MRGVVGLDYCPLTDLDWRVVEIARMEKPETAEGPLARLFRTLFSRPVAPGLANGKLEALRRFCVHAWHRDNVPGDDAQALINVGYTAPNVSEILRYVAGLRGFLPVLEEKSFG